MNISVLGIDLAKNVFQLHGVDEQGKVVEAELIRSLERSVINFLQQCMC
jgi:hypothetical protein